MNRPTCLYAAVAILGVNKYMYILGINLNRDGEASSKTIYKMRIYDQYSNADNLNVRGRDML